MELCQIRKTSHIYGVHTDSLVAYSDSVSLFLALYLPNLLFCVCIVVNLILLHSFTSPVATSTKKVNHGQSLFLLTDNRNKTEVGGFAHYNLIADKWGEKGLSA